jgi:cytochrome c553
VPLVPLVGLAACRGAESRPAGRDAAPIYGVALPRGYRDWRLITVAREQGKLDDLRAVLGNDAALRAFREGTRPFPDGTVMARVAWSYVSAPDDDRVLGDSVSHVAGAPKNGVQIMVKDSRRYPASGGWGFAQFNDGKPAAASVQASCVGCHSAVRSRDFVFSRYAP